MPTTVPYDPMQRVRTDHRWGCGLRLGYFILNRFGLDLGHIIDYAGGPPGMIATPTSDADWLEQDGGVVLYGPNVNGVTRKAVPITGFPYSLVLRCRIEDVGQSLYRIDGGTANHYISIEYDSFSDTVQFRHRSGGGTADAANYSYLASSVISAGLYHTIVARVAGPRSDLIWFDMLTDGGSPEQMQSSDDPPFAVAWPSGLAYDQLGDADEQARYKYMLVYDRFLDQADVDELFADPKIVYECLEPVAADEFPGFAVTSDIHDRGGGLDYSGGYQ